MTTDSERRGGMGWIPGLVGISGRTSSVFLLGRQLIFMSMSKSHGEIYLRLHIHGFFVWLIKERGDGFHIMLGPLSLICISISPIHNFTKKGRKKNPAKLYGRS